MAAYMLFLILNLLHTLGMLLTPHSCPGLRLQLAGRLLRFCLPLGG